MNAIPVWSCTPEIGRPPEAQAPDPARPLATSRISAACSLRRVRRRPRKCFSLLASLAASASLLTACGSASTATSAGRSTATAAGQSDNAQPIRHYMLILGRIMAPFRHFPLHPGDYAEARELLQTATGQLEALIPPQEFLTSHDNLLSGLRAQLALVPQQERAAAAGDTAALAGIKTEDVRQQRSIDAALAEAGEELERCKSDNFSC